MHGIMGDLYYKAVWMICAPPLWAGSRRVLLHRDRVPRKGPFILAPNHLSPYDVACLMLSTRRHLDFLSIVEMQRKPWAGPFFRNMNCVFVDRERRDNPSVHAMERRLRAGRVIAMFPEGYIRREEDSVIHGGKFRPGVVRLAQLSGAPILPCVVLGAANYSTPWRWIPLKLWKQGINYGELIHVPAEGGEEAAAKALEKLKTAYLALYSELRGAMPE
jgi:1-acyl-sn-glycerol-3-phosphate acyltransferase